MYYTWYHHKVLCITIINNYLLIIISDNMLHHDVGYNSWIMILDGWSGSGQDLDPSGVRMGSGSGPLWIWSYPDLAHWMTPRI